jgi:hypothetical protein
MTASGETLLPDEMPDITLNILKQGHFVNITTNGTLTKQLNELLKRTEGYHSHLHISFSLHYTELLKKNLLDVFFKNVQTAREDGCSILVQINLVDEYIPHWDEIKRICIEKVGGAPQVALTRQENNGTYSILSNLSYDEYVQIGKKMDSPLFEFTVDHFNIRRTEYCYAGLWSAKVYLGSGIMTGCYGQGIRQNIFDNLDKPIIFEPIGKHCSMKYCVNSSHFISQGIIPELLPKLSYGELRNRENAQWYTPEMKRFLYSQFTETNPLLSPLDKWCIDVHQCYRKLDDKKFLKNIIKHAKKIIPH